MSKEFSLCKRILMDVDPRYRKDAEHEFSVTSDESLNRDSDLGQEGFCIPSEVFTGKRDLTVATEGTDLVADEVQNTILNVKSNQPAVVRAGATVWGDLSGDISIPRSTGEPTAAWYSENAVNTESTPTFDQVNLSPERVAGCVEISRRLLIQATPDIEAWVRNALLRQVNLAIDLAAINGTGTNNQPEGILQTTGIGAYSATSTAESLTWDMCVGLWKEVAIDNTDVDNLAWLTSPAVVAEMMKTRKDTGSGKFILEDRTSGLLGNRIVTSNQVPTDLQSAGDKAALIVGDFRDLYIGLFGSPVIIVDPYTSAKSGLVRLVVEQYCDIGVAHANSFSATQDIIIT